MCGEVRTANATPISRSEILASLFISIFIKLPPSWYFNEVMWSHLDYERWARS